MSDRNGKAIDINKRHINLSDINWAMIGLIAGVFIFWMVVGSYIASLI